MNVNMNKYRKMDEQTRLFLEDEEFDRLFEVLSATHKPKKAALDDEKKQGIGEIIVNFQRLEFSIKLFTSLLLDIADDNELLEILTNKTSFGNLQAILLALARKKDFDRIDDLEATLKKASKAEETRNRIIHSVWTSGPRVKSKIDRKKGLVFQFEDLDADQLREIAEQINRIDTAIGSLSFHYIDSCLSNRIPLKGVRLVKSTQ